MSRGVAPAGRDAVVSAHLRAYSPVVAPQTALRGEDGVRNLGPRAATMIVNFPGASKRQALERTLATTELTGQDLHSDSDAVREEFDAWFGSPA